ncbi:sel1 repeat family protein [Mariprofundus sp. EBB-1]|uniref:SEL1-like repeat protein n=1 Tax=Mariprofundus sp. EBB-1 TaxID=2650971 RepID=UPI000EF20241|nr:tetratricopeptide repeat protein [Mariprofundus sp. EBB-1]RLL50799.1 sel1 repeat family protein [Mariprofundus sp. EBB-1]
MKIVTAFMALFLWTHLAFAENANTISYMDAAQISIDKQDWGQAEVFLLKVVKKQFNDVHARYLLGKVAEERGELRLAKKRYKMVLLVDRKHLLALKGWARVAEKLNDNVFATYQRLLTLEPQNVLWHIKLAQHYMKNGSIKAEPYLKSALEISPNHRQALQLMVKFHKKYAIAAHAEPFQKRLNKLSASGQMKRPLLLSNNQPVIQLDQGDITQEASVSNTVSAVEQERKIVAHTEPNEKPFDESTAVAMPSPEQKESSVLKSNTRVKPSVHAVQQSDDPLSISLSSLFSTSKLWVQKLTMLATPSLEVAPTKSEPEVKAEQTAPKLMLHSIPLPKKMEEKHAAQSDISIFQQYTLAVKQGKAHDQFILGLMYHEGRGVVKNDSQAKSLLMKAAKQGLDEAQLSLALMLYKDRSNTKNEKAAVRWFKKAANQGLADAQYALGLIFASNDRYKNEVKAVKWWKAAAHQGHAQAQHNLGVMYLNGRGVSRSKKEASRWLQQSGNQIHSERSLELEHFYSGEKNDTIIGRSN